MSEAVDVKYAYLIFKSTMPLRTLSTAFQFDATTELNELELKSKIPTDEIPYWKEWLGSMAWNQIFSGEHLVLSSWCKTSTPDVMDQENEDLQKKLNAIFRLAPLAWALTPPFEDVSLISGTAKLLDGSLHPISIRSYSKVKAWTRAFYNHSKGNWDLYHKWAYAHDRTNEIVENWKHCYLRYFDLFVHNKKSVQIFEAFRSFNEGLHGSQLEFRMPNLVRSIECLIDCYGADDFSEKVFNFLGAPDSSLPFGIQANTKLLLKDLYRLRNDCSHGKTFAYSFEKDRKKKPTEFEVGQLEFLAEWAARRLLQVAFDNTTILQHSSDRDALVAAWGAKLIKP